MKQHTSTDQLNELSDAAKARLKAWWTPTEGDWIVNLSASPKPYVFANYRYQPSPHEADWELEVTEEDKDRNYLHLLPSIGQMIEYFHHDGAWLCISNNDTITPDYRQEVRYIRHEGKDDELRIRHTSAELCDALWEVMKEALELELLGALDSADGSS